MIKRSTILNIKLFLNVLSCLGSICSITPLLILIFLSESIITKIPCMGMIIFLAFNAISTGAEIKLEVGTRIANRRSGILEDPIPSDHGNTISEVICGIRNEAVEYVAYFTLDGKKISESTLNSPLMTALLPEKREVIKKLSGCISVHNHPGDQIIAFSPNDISTAVTRHIICSIVVTKDLCFVMRMPEGKHLNPFYVYRVANEAYRGDDCEAASFELCAAIAKRFGFSFYAIPFSDSVYHSMAISTK